MSRFVATMLLFPLAAGVALALAIHPGGTPGAHATTAPPAADPGSAASDEPPPAPAHPPHPRPPGQARTAEPAPSPSARAGRPEPTEGGQGAGPKDPLNPSTAADPEAYLRTIRALLEPRPILALRYARQMREIHPDQAYEVERLRYEIEALVNLGRLSEAEPLAEDFMEQYPDRGQHSYRVLYLLNERIRR